MATYAFEINQKKSAVIRFTLCKQYFYNENTDTYDFVPYAGVSAFAQAVNQGTVIYSRGKAAGGASTLSVNGYYVPVGENGYSTYEATPGTPILVRQADISISGTDGKIYPVYVFTNIQPVVLTSALTDISAETQRLDVTIPFALTSTAQDTADNPTVWKWYVKGYLTAGNNDPENTFDLGSGTITLTYKTDQTRKPNCKSSVELVVG